MLSMRVLTRNSPVHSSKHILCSESGKRPESNHRSPSGYSPGPQQLSLTRACEPAPVNTTSFTAPMQAQEYYRNLEVFDPTYHNGNYHNGHPRCTLYSPELYYYGPLVSNAGGSLWATPQPFGSPTDFGGIAYEPPAPQQPPVPPAAPEGHNTEYLLHACRWLGGPECDGLAPGRNREMGEHLRVHHHFIGHERDTVQCEWEGCGSVMQRMNVARHIVSRHLLASAACRICSKQFSRPDVVGRHEKTCRVVPQAPRHSIPRI